jgi:hypothetical protein
MRNYGNIDVYIESGLFRNQSTHGLARHGGFLATQGGRLIDTYIVPSDTKRETHKVDLALAPLSFQPCTKCEQESSVNERPYILDPP